MNNDYLDFAISFFHKLNLVTTIVDVNKPLPNDLDLGLRNSIIEMTENKKYLTDNNFLQLNFTNEKTIYLFEDKYNCHYIIFPLYHNDDNKLFIIGPYLTENASILRSNDLCKTLGVPDTLFQFIHQYLCTLPCIQDISFVETFIDTVAEKLYGVGKYSIEYIRQDYDNNTVYKSEINTTDNYTIMQRMEYRYNLEKIILDSISRGDFNSAMRALNDKAFRNIDNRVPNTLRSKKNTLIVFNTLCRKGAEYGKVHPIHLDKISRQMAIKIENMISIDQETKLQKDILKAYCYLVQQHSTSGYSPTMQRVLVHISQHLLDTDLSLQKTASALALNKTYLANIFKKETGVTFTSFVNEQRINHAIFLLNTSDDQIQTIASACGIPDITYFTRIFKNLKGITPSAYKKMIKQKQ